MSTTYVSGEIDIAKLSPEKKAEIKQVVESFYGANVAEEIFCGDYLSFEEEWPTHEDTDSFMSFLLRITNLIDRNTVARLMCEGDTHNDYWGVIIKKGKLYIQRYVLKPVGEKKEFIYSPTI